MKEIEPTVEVLDAEDTVETKLQSVGFELVEEYTMDDIYMSNKHSSIHELSNYEILKNTFLIRNINNQEIELQYKKKEYDEKGDTISDEKYRIPIKNIDNAKKFFEGLGFKEIFQMSTKNIVYRKDEIELVVQKVKNLGTFLEVEMFVQENESRSKREEIYEILKNLPIRIGTDFDVKKAHLVLNKIREE